MTARIFSGDDVWISRWMPFLPWPRTRRRSRPPAVSPPPESGRRPALTMPPRGASARAAARSPTRCGWIFQVPPVPVPAPAERFPASILWRFFCFLPSNGTRSPRETAPTGFPSGWKDVCSAPRKRKRQRPERKVRRRPRPKRKPRVLRAWERDWRSWAAG